MSLLTRRLRRMAWRARISRRSPLVSSSDDTATVLITCFHPARSHNLEPLVKHLLRCSFVDRVVVSNHNPALAAELHACFTDRRVTVVSQDVPTGCGYRWQVAQSFPFRHLISLDDDVLLYPLQLETLFRGLLARPEVPHGISGLCIARDGTVEYHQRVSRSVDYLTEVYAITRAHLVQYFRLYNSQRRRPTERSAAGEPAADFVLLSRSGTGRPLIHDVGYILRCETYKDPDVATWRRPGFWARVASAAAELDELQ